MEEEANSLAETLCANMNDLVSSFWNKIMRECGLETWTVGDTCFSEPPSPFEKLLKTPMHLTELFDQDGGTPTAEEENEIPPSIGSEGERIELHSIDSFTDNEQFDEIFAGVATEVHDGSSSDNADDSQIIKPDMADADTSSAGEEYSEEVDQESSDVMEANDEDSKSTEQSSFEEDLEAEVSDAIGFARPALGTKRSHDGNGEGFINSKQARVLKNSLAGCARPRIRMNLIGID